jgi:hypothetical protein
MRRIDKVQPAAGFHVPDQMHAPASGPMPVQVHDNIHRRRTRHRPPPQYEVGWHALMGSQPFKALNDQPTWPDPTLPR